MTNEISELLEHYGTSLAETRALMPKLTEAIKRQRAVKPPTFPTMPEFLTSEEAKEMIDETKYISKLLRGARGEATSDIALVEELLLRLSQLITHFPQIKEVEANPLVVWKEGAVAIDARLRFQ